VERTFRHVFIGGSRKPLSGGSVNFKVILEKDEDGVVVATVPSLPGCISQGRTRREALSNIREAIDLHVSGG